MLHNTNLHCLNQARSQRPPSGGAEEIQGVVTFGSKLLTDNFIVTKNSCKRVCFFAKKRRNSVKSNTAVRLFWNVRWTRFACRAVVIDRRCGHSMPRAAMLSMAKTIDIERPKAFRRWTMHPSTSISECHYNQWKSLGDKLISGGGAMPSMPPVATGLHEY